MTRKNVSTSIDLVCKFTYSDDIQGGDIKHYYYYYYTSAMGSLARLLLRRNILYKTVLERRCVHFIFSIRPRPSTVFFSFTLTSPTPLRLLSSPRSSIIGKGGAGKKTERAENPYTDIGGRRGADDATSRTAIRAWAWRWQIVKLIGDVSQFKNLSSITPPLFRPGLLFLSFICLRKCRPSVDLRRLEFIHINNNMILWYAFSVLQITYNIRIQVPQCVYCFKRFSKRSKRFITLIIQNHVKCVNACIILNDHLFSTTAHTGFMQTDTILETVYNFIRFAIFLRKITRK